MSFAIGSLFTVAGVAISGPVASFYGEPAVQPLFAVLSLSFVLTSMQVTQASLLQREMRFRELTLRRTASIMVGGVAGIVIAVLGYGAWALVGQQVAVSVVSTVLLWTLSSWRPRWTFSISSLRDLGGFSLNLFGARLVNFFNRNVDSLLIGRVLGSAPLGLYSVAYNIILMPLYRLVNPIQDVLFPAYSRLQDDRQRLAGAWLKVMELTGAVLFPALIGLIVVAPDFVPVVLGNQWRNAVPVIQVLAIVGLLQGMGVAGSRILEALGRPGIIFRVTVLELVALVPAIVIGLRWGVVGVAVGWALVTIPISILFAWLTTRALGLPLMRLFTALSGIAQAALLMGAIVLLAREGLTASDTATGARLALLIVAGVAAYVPLCLWRAPGVRRELSGMLGRRRATTSAATAADA
jgi:O-antigen/teichoic acid export membrane protein